MNLAAKTTWNESLTCSTIYNPLIHQHFGEPLLKDTGCNATMEGLRGKANRVASSW